MFYLTDSQIFWNEDTEDKLVNFSLLNVKGPQGCSG